MSDNAAPHKNATVLSRPRKPLYGRQLEKRSFATMLMKAAIRDETERSAQGETIGRKPHPFDMVQAGLFLTSNTHHAASIKAKQNATTGLGFLTAFDMAMRQNEKRARAGMTIEPDSISEEVLNEKQSKVAKALNPMCSVSFQDLMDHVGEDLANTHNGYIEVVRRGGDPVKGPITGLHHIPAAEVFVHVENRAHDYHYEVVTTGVEGGVRRFARFGDKADFMERPTGGKAPGTSGELSPEAVSEVIHFRYPSSMSRYYGIPTWLSAVASIELVQALHQHEFDFYNNRGVPEFLLFLMGKKLGSEEWDEVEKLFQAQIGPGNAFKSGAFNFGDDMTVQLEKLAMEGKSDGRFQEMANSLALEIVSGHRIPPLLAGITIPGKLGATNELPNALMAYQTLTVAPDQTTLQATLGCTLGETTVNGGLPLTFEDFEMRSILDVMDLGRMDTIARMRETVPEAEEEGRDVDAGLEKSILDHAGELDLPTLSMVFSAMVVQAAEKSAK